MSESIKPQNDLVFEQLTGKECDQCDGILLEDFYKGDRTVICGDCGVPVFRSFATQPTTTIDAGD